MPPGQQIIFIAAEKERYPKPLLCELGALDLLHLD